MATFLLAISLLLNGISIFFIIILYARQNRTLEAEKTQEQFKKDIEAEISAFLFEMKEENEAFLKRFQQVRKTSPSDGNQTAKKLRSGLKEEGLPAKGGLDQMGQSESKEWTAKADQAFKTQAVKAYQQTIANMEENPVSGPNQIEEQPLTKNEPPLIEHEEIYRDLFINQVKILQNQGLAIEEIAKKLNKGKTEIELLLKFS